MFSSRFQSYLLLAIAANTLAFPVSRRQTDGDNNDNSGDILNGDNTTFGIDGSDDVSGLFNVGSGNTFGVDGTTVTGNSETISTRKRQTTTGDNNDNGADGTITNGDTTGFTVDGSNNIFGAFNAGSGNNFTGTDANIGGPAARKRQITDGDNNSNSGNIIVGSTTSFGINDSDDVSGAFNVGNNNTLGLSNSTLTGNSEAAATRKRQITGDNNSNAGNITVGDATTFGISNSSDVSGAFNAGSQNNLSLNGTTLTGNTETAGTRKRQTTTGDNNDNEGDINNGNTTSFSIGNSTDVSGAYNVGSGNTLGLNNSTLTGNTVGSATRKRQTTGDNNDNEGDITNGNTTTFGITDSDDVSGVFNAGSDNTVSLDGSTVIGNTETGA